MYVWTTFYLKNRDTGALGEQLGNIVMAAQISAEEESVLDILLRILQRKKVLSVKSRHYADCSFGVKGMV